MVEFRPLPRTRSRDARATSSGASAGALRTSRWNDPPPPDEGTRILVCRYRPRGIPKQNEPWDEWCAELGPSRALHAAAYGKGQPALEFSEYRRRFLDEMTAPRARFFLRGLATRIERGESLSLLCSSACTDEARCHRSILRELVLDLLRAERAAR
jgi:uncharacterized protein YeaO (DUF488 family)